MKKKMSKKFHEYYDSLPEEHRVKIRDQFLERTGLIYSTWYNKMMSNRFSNLEIEVLEEITGMKLGMLSVE